MRWLVFFAAIAAQAAVISGVVIDAPSGYPVSRATVTIQPWTGGRPGRVDSKLSDRGGRFTFDALPAGSYLVTATRNAYAVAEWGQRTPSGPGKLIDLGADDATFVELRLRRLASISGQVVDENFVGLPDSPVYVYTATRPRVVAGRGKSDDRGNFRIGRLEPGRYLVRNGMFEVEDGNAFIPTYSPTAVDPGEARVYTVRLDEDAGHISVQPRFGELGTLEVLIPPVVPAYAATVTIVSDTERRSAGGAPGSLVSFPRLPPGHYEVTIEIEPLVLASYSAVDVARRTGSGGFLRSKPVIKPEIFVDGKPGKPDDARVWIRHKPLDAPGPPILVKEQYGPTTPGYWEYRAEPREGLAVDPTPEPQFMRRVSRAGLHPDWFEFHSDGQPRIRLTSRTGAITGRVTTGTNNAVSGAPVYLLPVEADVRRAIGGTRAVRADTNGLYRFPDLPGGTYVVASSYEFEMLDLELIEPHGKRVVLPPGQGAAQDLTLHGSRD